MRKQKAKQQKQDGYLTTLETATILNISKQWIALNACADWLLKLRISFAIDLRATGAEFAPENLVIFAGINELKSSFCAILSHCFSIY